MHKIEPIEIDLEGVAYFGIQCPLLKGYNVAHFINKFFEINLAKTIDFESYATGKRIIYPSYACASEAEYCTYYLIENKKTKKTDTLFPSYLGVDFWFLAQFKNGLHDHRFLALKEKLHNDLPLVEGVFSVLQAEPENFTKDSDKKKYNDFKIDFSEYRDKLIRERKQEEPRNRRQDKRLR